MVAIPRFPTTCLPLFALVALLALPLSGCDSAGDDPDPVPDPISSTFQNGIDGWTGIGDPSSFITHRFDSFANQGWIRYYEAGGGAADFFVAPAKFRGNLSQFYGGSLSYDIRVSNLFPAEAATDYVQLRGAGLTLVYRDARPPTCCIWHSFTINLNATAGWQVAEIGSNNIATGTTPATEAQLRQVLAAVDLLRIRADYRVGTHYIDLDNVVIEAAN